MKLTCIYRLEFPNGEFYIGATTNFQSRRKQHLTAVRRKQVTNKHLHANLAKYPICGIYPIASLLPEANLAELEKQIITQEDPPLNIIGTTKEGTFLSAVSRTFGPHRSLTDAASALGVSYRHIKRIADRYSYEDWMYMKARELTVDGVKRSVLDWAKLSGLSAKTIHSRLRLGWADAQAVEPVARVRESKMHLAREEKIRDSLASGRLVELDGITATPRAHARSRGIGEHRLWLIPRLLRRGVSLEKIIADMLEARRKAFIALPLIDITE